MKYAIIKDGIVENCIEYAEPPSTPPPGFPDGYQAIASERAGRGWHYAHGTFSDPTPPSVPLILPPVLTLIEQILANPIELAKLKAALGVTV